MQGSPKCSIVGDKIEGEKLEHLGGSGGMLPRKTAYPAFSEHFLADKRNLFVSIVDTFNVVPKIKWIQNLQPA